MPILTRTSRREGKSYLDIKKIQTALEDVSAEAQSNAVKLASKILRQEKKKVLRNQM